MLQLRGMVRPSILRVHPFDEPFELICPLRGPRAPLTATFIDANHCPGSCMVLIEGDTLEHPCLHTGDFRYYPELDDHDALRRVAGGSGAIVFLDVTFGAERRSCRTFPSKEQSVCQLLNLVDAHPCENIVMHSIGLGDELLLTKLSLARGELLVASKSRLDMLRVTSSGLSCTLLGDDTRLDHLHGRAIVASPKSVGGLRRRGLDGIHIKCSILWWVLGHNTEIDAAEPVLHNSTWHIPFSMHCSLSELRCFLDMMQPRSIKPICACASGDNIADDLQNYVERLDVGQQAHASLDYSHYTYTLRAGGIAPGPLANDTLARLLDSQRPTPEPVDTQAADTQAAGGDSCSITELDISGNSCTELEVSDSDSHAADTQAAVSADAEAEPAPARLFIASPTSSPSFSDSPDPSDVFEEPIFAPPSRRRRRM